MKDLDYHQEGRRLEAGKLGPSVFRIRNMFFLQELEKTIQLHPSFFGPRVKEYLTNRLYEQVEGTCNGYYYVICVVDAFDISEGRIVPGLANAEYVIRYRAVVWKPFKGEVVRASQAHGIYSLLTRATR